MKELLEKERMGIVVCSLRAYTDVEKSWKIQSFIVKDGEFDDAVFELENKEKVWLV
jgi:hypothetical protein